MRTQNVISNVVGLLIASHLLGCSPVAFNTPPASCDGAANCSVGATGQKSFDYVVTTGTTPVDILFVDDNSGSMSRDQRSLGSKFSSLFNIIAGFDYHIGIVTTDISGPSNPPRAINQQGALQDGNLISFASGVSFLTPSTVNAAQLFQSTIQRPETANCDQYLLTHDCSAGQCSDYANQCASDDSRAIYAANLVVTNNQGGFLRANAPLEVVILSNSDERVWGGTQGGPALEALDQPSSLIQNIQTTFGGSKSVTVHTIVIQPGDVSCLRQEAFTPLIFGQYAPVYASLSSMTSGVLGTICASDYSSQLSAIGQLTQQNLQSSFSLQCQTDDQHLTYTLSPSSSDVGHVDSGGQNLVFATPVPQGTQIHLTYSCLN